MKQLVGFGEFHRASRFNQAPACSNQDELRLVAEHTLMRAASLRLVPRDEGTPSPACHLQGITGCRQLPPVCKAHEPAAVAGEPESLLHPHDRPEEMGTHEILYGYWFAG